MSFSPPNEWTQGEAEFWAYLDGTVALALALLIEPKDGSRLCFTSAQRDVLLPGKTWGQIAVPTATHFAGEGVFPKSLQQSRDPRKVDNWEFTAFVADGGDSYVRQDDVLKGRFLGARYSLRIYARDNLNWQLLRQRGELGERSLDKGACTWKMKGLSNKLAAEVLEVTSPLSRATWGDDELAFFNLDGQTHDGFAARVAGAVSSVSAIWPRRWFTLNAAKNYPAGRFTDGLILWTSGPNAGVESSILDFDTVTGTFLLDEDTPFPIAVGHGARAQIRAPLTIEEWRLFFGTGEGFAGEPGIPSLEAASNIKNG